ncbi:hypothetical protein P2318_06790 [Myxococcaceae bacterium GXIMD 01537]
MANILILKCLKDDDDGSMDAMGDSLKDAKESKDHTVTVLDFKDVLPKKNRSFGFENNEKFDEVYFSGHSRYFEPTTNFGTKAWVVRAIANRTVGGYTIDELLLFIHFAIDTLKAKTVVLFSCESALTVASYEFDGKGVEEISYDLTPQREGQIRRWVNLGHNKNVSLLQVVALKALDKLRAQAKKPTVSFTGMNGVGYISPGDDKIVTFDQVHLPKLARVHERRMTAEDFETECVDTKKSPHAFTYVLNP